jgi:CRISPR system Cascade subunit CasE
MTSPAWLTRVSLSRSASARALVSLIAPDDPARRAETSHRLLWTLFGDTPERSRDYLWREEGQGRFTLLSARPPEDHHALFDPFEPKPFDPAWVIGDRVRFTLRANATVKRRGEKNRSDVVMDAIHALPKGARAGPRREAEQAASRNWLEAQGASHGFAVTHMDCLGYETLAIPRKGAKPIELGVVELEGHLTVTDPAAFSAKLLAGFGRGRAFGCGLMLVARSG